MGNVLRKVTYITFLLITFDYRYCIERFTSLGTNTKFPSHYPRILLSHAISLRSWTNKHHTQDTWRLTIETVERLIIERKSSGTLTNSPGPCVAKFMDSLRQGWNNSQMCENFPIRYLPHVRSSMYIYTRMYTYVYCIYEYIYIATIKKYWCTPLFSNESLFYRALYISFSQYQISVAIWEYYCTIRNLICLDLSNHYVNIVQ